MNTNKLLALINARGLKRAWVASYLGITESSLRNKINGTCEFKVSEIEKLGACLNMSREDFIDIFFHCR